MSPILFNIYVSDLSEVVENFGVPIIMYVDDLKIYNIFSDHCIIIVLLYINIIIMYIYYYCIIVYYYYIIVLYCIFRYK